MISEELKTLVLTEANNLLIYATKEERDKLDFSLLDGQDPWLCIYGQMTGYCNGDRAFELVKLCGIPYSESIIILKRATSFIEFGQLRYQRNFTAIELYINRKGAKNEELIAYLKGETDTLIL